MWSCVLILLDYKHDFAVFVIVSLIVAVLFRESHLSASSDVYVPQEKVTVTEYQVVREVLW